MRLFPAILVIACFAAPFVRADTVVYPTGSYPADVEAVQAAVSAGGRVLLKAVDLAGAPTVFDFGPPVAGSGFVRMTTDVDIRGEVVGGVRTTIRGGNAPFLGELPVRSAVRDIHFDGPRSAAVILAGSAGAEISGNFIHDVVGMPWTPTETKAMGVWVIGGPAGGYGPVTGTVTISNNTIADMHGHDGIGLALVGYEADMRVTGNDIRGTNFVGILAFAHSGPTWIQDNDVTPGPELYPGTYSVGNGIQVGPLFVDMFPTPTAPALVNNNRVACANPNADGIVVYGGDLPLDHSAVTNNQVKMSGSLFGGVTLYDNVSHTVIAGNRVWGSGAYALDAVAFSGPPQRGNLFFANGTARFSETVADVFLADTTADSWVIGCQGTALDQGSGNHVFGCATTGAPPSAPGPVTEGPAYRRDPGALLESTRAAIRALREETR
jgi:Right handed beta helix region